MPATADYLAEHPFAPPDIVNPPEAPTYRYRPDINSLVDLAGIETADLSAGSRVDILIDNLLQTYVLQTSAPTGSDLEVVPDDFDAVLNQQYWLLVATSTLAFIGIGSISFSDISGTISVDQLPPESVVTVDSIGEDALYFFDNDTNIPSLISADNTVNFLSGHINFTNIAGTISIDQFPAGSVASIDSIDEDALYFFDNDLFVPELIGKADALSFLLPDQTSNDGFFLQTNAGVLSWAAASSGATAWGDVTGTLSDQTDLQSALDAKQGLDSDLTTIAGLTATTDNFIVSVSSAWASRTPSQVRTTLGLVIGTNIQAWDADLDTLAGLTATTNNFIVSVSSAWASRTPTQVKTTLAIANTDVSGLGTLSTQNGTFSGTSSGTNTGDQDLSGYQPLDSDLTTIAGLTATTDNFIVSVSSAWASRTPSQVRTTLGLVIGTDVQAWDADLDTLAGLTATTNNFIVSVSSAWASRTPAQVLTTLAAVGTTFQPLDSDLTTLAGLTATTDNFIVSVSSAWASRTPAQVLSTLAAVGTTFQPLDSDLTTIAGLTATTDNFVVSVASAWASRTPSQVKTTLGLVIGTNVQAWDADLDTWAGVTPGTGVGTALAVNVGTDGAFVVKAGALGTPSAGTLTNCTALPIAGLTASTSTALGVGSIELGAASDTTLARASAGRITVEGVPVLLSAPRVTSISSNATWSPNADTDDIYEITAQAADATTISNPSGTPVNGQKLIIRATGTAARALTWSGSQWRASSDLALPTTTTTTKTLYLGFIYNSTGPKWDLVAKLDNF